MSNKYGSTSTHLRRFVTASIISFLFMGCFGCNKNVVEEKIPWPPKIAWPEHADFGYTDSQGNLILRSLNEGGETKRVANLKHAGIYDFWTWAPDGRSIYCGAQKELYLLSEDGEATFICTYGDFPQLLSPNCSKIAYLEPIPNNELRSYAKEMVEQFPGKSPYYRLVVKSLEDQSIITIFEGDIRTFDWFYGSDGLIYSSICSMEGPTNQIILHDISTGAEEILLQGELGDNTYTEIECSSKAPLICIGIEGEDNLKKLALYNYETKTLRDLYAEWPSGAYRFSPDGQLIQFFNGKSDKEPESDIIVIDLDGNILHELAYNDKCFDTEGDNRLLNWSPDGKKISITRYNNSNPVIYVWDMSLDTEPFPGNAEHYVERVTFDESSSDAQWNPNPY